MVPVGAAQFEHGEVHGPLSLAEKFEGLLGAMAWVAPQVSFLICAHTVVPANSKTKSHFLLFDIPAEYFTMCCTLRLTNSALVFLYYILALLLLHYSLSALFPSSL